MAKLRFLAILITALFISGQALAEKRIALVIGNGDYSNIGALANPPNDAKLIAAALRQLGFEVIETIDADQKTMKLALKAFGKKLTAAGKDAVGLFYYAGHGVQIDGENYLIPINVNIDVEADVDIEAVSATNIHKQMAYAGNRLNIIILDACRNNPFKQGFRSASLGLAKMDATKGTLIAYATAPGNVAADGKGTNSPYSEALSKAMLTEGLTVERMFKMVRNEVVAVTNDRQVPWEASSLTGADFYFKGGPGAPAPSASGPTPDMVFWSSIKDKDKRSDFETFIKSYPDSPFSALARTRLAAFKPQWPKFAAATYEGELTNPVRPAADRVITRLKAVNDTLEGSYTIFEPTGETTGKLIDFRILAKRKGVFLWRDAYGEGSLYINFSEDYRSFQGRWDIKNNPEDGGTLSGQRK